MILIVLDKRDLPLELPERGCRQLLNIAEHGLSLHHARFTRYGRTIPAWILRPSAEVDRQVRNLRVHLSRLHSERESLRILLRESARGRLDIGSPNSTLLRTTVGRQAGLLLRMRSSSQPTAPLYDLAREADALVTLDDSSQLEAALTRNHPGLLETMRLASPGISGAIPVIELPAAWDRYVMGPGRASTNINLVLLRELKLDQSHNIEVTAGRDVSGVVAGHVDRTLILLDRSGADEEVKALGILLVSAARQLMETLNADDAEVLRDDTDALVAEMARKIPRLERLRQVSGDVAAIAVAGETAGAPLMKAIREIGKFFGL